jgi:ATP-dependent Clp protease ATP-binding subunit ClpC
LDNAKLKWEEETKSKRYLVDEENVAEVIGMMTGIPTSRIAQNEGLKLLGMGEKLTSKVVGQEDAIKKLVKAIQRTRVGVLIQSSA